MATSAEVQELIAVMNRHAANSQEQINTLRTDLRAELRTSNEEYGRGLTSLSQLVNGIVDRVSALERLGVGTTNAPAEQTSEEQIGDQDDRSEPGQKKWAFRDKNIMAGISELTKPTEWHGFSTQVRLMLDTQYLFVHQWVREMKTLERRPTDPDMRAMTGRLGLDGMEPLRQFLEDLWKVLAVKVKGTRSDGAKPYPGNNGYTGSTGHASSCGMA